MHKFLVGVVMFGVGVVTASDDDCGEQMDTFAICSERYRIAKCTGCLENIAKTKQVVLVFQ